MEDTIDPIIRFIVGNSFEHLDMGNSPIMDKVIVSNFIIVKDIGDTLIVDTSHIIVEDWNSN